MVAVRELGLPADLGFPLVRMRALALPGVLDHSSPWYFARDRGFHAHSQLRNLKP